MGNQRNLRRPPEWQIQSLDAQDHSPADDAQQNGQPHQHQGSETRHRVDQTEHPPQFTGAVLPASLPLFRSRKGVPRLAETFCGKLAFPEKNRMKNPKHQNSADHQPPADAPDLSPGFHVSPQICFK